MVEIGDLFAQVRLIGTGASAEEVQIGYRSEGGTDFVDLLLVISTVYDSNGSLGHVLRLR